ncbi:transcriptional regulator WhiB-like [Gordonia phage Daredevil]|uniref:WhiB family transcription factor n=1 Tax=Gordonia phage Daredevil TaxID=2283286 RepID=A0A345MIS5_9CAUD|nr:transcriptional regulator WhiB-like [Gordonia phage Daredevil]AXH70456.1 WhiB family transcription factor [Gordonia phage Daredevil]
MTTAFCRTAEDRNRWFTDSRRGPMQNYARSLCAPCGMHQPCAAYALSVSDAPIGVIVAGVALSEDTSTDSYKQAYARLQAIANGEEPDEDTPSPPPDPSDRMIAASLRPEHAGKMLQVGSLGGVIHEVRARIRPSQTCAKAIDIHVRINTERGMKSLVLTPTTPVVIR